jgi:Ca2+-binding RTX toxin-like protein
MPNWSEITPATAGGADPINQFDLDDGLGGSHNFTGVESVGIYDPVTLSLMEVFRLGSSGADTIDASVETARAVILAGDGDDTVTGTAFSDSIDIRRGSDTVSAGNGDDYISARSGGTNSIDGGSGYDTVALISVEGLDATISDTQIAQAGTGAGTFALSGIESLSYTEFGTADKVIDASAATFDVSIGANEGSDTISGGSGDDRLSGGLSADTLSGGAVSDTFRYGIYSGIVGALDGDVITDLEAGEVINFSSADSQDGISYSFIGTIAFSGLVGEVRYEASGGETLVRVDTDGDASADETLTISNGEFELDLLSDSYGVFSLMASIPPTPLDLAGTGGSDTLIGGAGNDLIRAFAGDDILDGGDGDDDLRGGAGDDTISGGAGTDIVTAWTGGRPDHRIGRQ